MAPTAAPAPPVPKYTITKIEPIGHGLWQISVVMPGGDLARIILSFNNLTLQNVILSTEAIGTLLATHDGASPVIRPFQ